MSKTKTILQTVRFKNQDVSKLYQMYLDSKHHSLLTGGGKAKISAKTGISFSAWDGYIIGKNLELIKNKLIVQTWLAADWENPNTPSVLILLFEQEGKDAIISMTHSGVPIEHAEGIKKGWDDFYWKPWKVYLEHLEA
ncbi:MAG: SRPBCC domain-containing protein [Bacteroidetes bacterium]|nr:SRPBCC domain-containing protein [Bacteroidota bacterium]